MDTELKSLHIPVNGVYWHQAHSGKKEWEYRLYNDRWISLLTNTDGTPKRFKDIQYKLGYPKAGDMSKILIFPWKGFEIIEDLVHPHFDNVPTKVFAIKLELDSV